MKKNYFLAILSLFFCFVIQSINAQVDVFSRSDSGTGDWGSANLPWFYSGSSQGDPDNGNTIRNFVKIGHNNNTTMTTNGRFYIFNTLDFQAGASSARTINNSGGGLSASGGIYSASTATHTFNTPIGIDGATVQLHANSSGGLTFTDNIFINSNTVNFGGSGAGNISVSGTMSGTGNVTKTGTNTLTVSGSNSYSGTTTISAGTLVLNASAASSAVTVESGATLQISSNATISSLTVNTGGMVTVDAGVTLTISNDLTLNSGSSMDVEETGSVTVTGNAIFKRNLANGTQWHLMSSPVSGETYDAAWATANSIPASTLDTDNIGVSTYDNSSADTADGGSDQATGHWRYLQTNDSNSSTFNDSQGYGIIRSASGDITFTGTNIYSADQTIGLTLGVNNFNLVGNPFTGSLNLGDFFTDNGAGVIAGAQAWFWNGSSYDVKTSGSHAAFEIAPGQGFFVEAAAATNLTFDIADVSHTSSTFQKSSPRPEITLTLSEGSDTRNAYIHYINGTTTDYDLGYDGKLFGGVNHSLAIYSQLISNDKGEKYQLQSLPNSDLESMVIPVGIKATAGEITFSANVANLPTDIKVFLEDRVANTFTRLDEANSKYSVTLNADANGIGQFYLHTSKSSLSTKSVNLNNISVYTVNKATLKIVGLSQGKSSVKLFNMLGKQVLNTNFTTNGVSEIALPNLSSGIYIVQIENANGKMNKKIVLE